MYLILRSKYFHKHIFTFHRLEYIAWNYICLLEIWILWFQKELAIPRFKISHMNFKKEISVPFRKILVPFSTTKDCHSCRSLLLVWQICSLNWDLDMDSFVWILCISIDDPVANYLLVMQGSWVQIQGVILLLFNDDILGSLGSNLVFIIPFGITYFLTENHEWLWKYVNEIWEQVLANSFSRKHKSNIICSVL